jgi:hypothetical protein
MQNGPDIEMLVHGLTVVSAALSFSPVVCSDRGIDGEQPPGPSRRNLDFFYSGAQYPSSQEADDRKPLSTFYGVGFL